MTLIVEILHSRALDLLHVLESLQVIRLREATPLAANLENRPVRTFEAISLDTRGFRFDREEANER
ncbi:MAG: hypothetical protein OHK0039_34700 [Bacteroidia bacterium]